MMLSEQQRQTLCESFLSLPKFERQLIALRIVCCECTDDRAFIGAIRKTGPAGYEFTEKTYQAHIGRFNKLGFTEKSARFEIINELHHDFLLLMPEEGMAWVYDTVNVLYGNHHKYYEKDYFSYRFKSQNRAHLIKAIYANDPTYFFEQPDTIEYGNKLVIDLSDIFAEYPLNIEWLQSRDKVIREYICVALLSNYYCDNPPSHDNDKILALFLQNAHENTYHDYLQYSSALIHLSQGKWDNVINYCSRIQNEKSGFYLALQATLVFLNGEFEQASKLYRKAITAIRKHSNIRNYYFDNILGVYHQFCLGYVDNNFAQLATNATHYDKYLHSTWTLPMPVYDLFPILALVEKGDQKTAKTELAVFGEGTEQLTHPLLMALHQLVCYIADKQYIKRHKDEIYNYLQYSIAKQHHMAAHLFYELLNTLEQYQIEVNTYFENSPFKLRLLTLIDVKDNWEYSFQALENLLVADAQTLENPDHNKRLLWLVDPERYDIDVIEQSYGKSGQWSRGRSVSLAKLAHYQSEPKFEYLTKQDKLAISGIMEEDGGWYGAHYEFSPYHTFIALIGHPNIVHYQNRDVAIELVAGEPELHIEEKKQGFHLSLSHYLKESGLIIEPESLNKYRVIDFSPAYAKIAGVLTKKGLSIPASAKDKILNVIQNAKRDIKIHVGIKDIDIPEIAGDAAPCIQLLPVNEGLRATLWVKPLANLGTYFKIGQGKETFMTMLVENGQDVRARVQRNLEAEKAQLAELFTNCPSLSQYEYEPGEYEIETTENVLDVLSELQQYALKKPFTIEWPQGQSFKIKQRVSGTNLSLNISSETNWFKYDGSMTLHDGEVVSMQELLDSLDNHSYGRFVRLGNGEFIELTSQLKKQLNVLHALSDDKKINPLGAQVLSDIAAQVEHITFDEGWQVHVKKIKTMRNHAPSVPSTLQASLRDYQLEGFQYLSRLTHWGIGACLADDMGLGKTVQTIALLLERAKKGASLVVAPTSVCFNWIEELAKFAPTLTVYDLRTDKRTALIEGLGKFDVVICSYGLLQHNEDLLINKQWETIVLDEAQAIKNANTQRWKAVMKLQGKSRIALSGTPIENHLGELWSIFSFINPGLLGSIKSFQMKYSIPIESKQSPDRIHALRALVAPYILRRIKSEVLSELPPKTEQTIHVQQSEEEATFYEALRRTAAERMAHFMAENNRLSVLAEITKLRQACCDSSLVDSAIAIENSKLNAFIETVKNIIDNGHKALVFSQYVSFLKIVKQRIEAEKIVYQYLDGSTSAPQRKKAVDAFQSGEGDLFLLSLKAGGSGLNLTAADYVIHLDPWWNPAVEDQASDRAHRIGQERPVTIYRFVMQNTIEEKIINLHEHKRNLANELLSGQSVTGKLSNDDLMNLISNSHGVL